MPVAFDWPAVITAMLLVPVAYAATNLDNLLIMASLGANPASRRNVILGFVAASIAVLMIASLASFIENLVPARLLGYIGFVPISIGVYLLFSNKASAGGETNSVAAWPAIAVLLFANSGDTVFALGPLFAESGDDARIGLATGFTLISGLWLLLILTVSSKVAESATLSRLGHRLAPWMMIIVGLYILADTATDVV
jgi:cadmium resistance protein CadD (predicted permease)